MKRLLVMYFALAIGCSAYAQNTIDTLKTDTLKKKKILIEDSWSNKKKKAKTKQTFQKFEHQDTMKVEFMNRDVVKAVETEGGAKIKVVRLENLLIRKAVIQLKLGLVESRLTLLMVGTEPELRLRKYILGIRIRINSLWKKNLNLEDTGQDLKWG